MGEGERAHRQGRFVVADAKYRHVLKLYPNHPAALHNLAFCTRQAIALAKQEGRATPADFEAAIAVARVLHAQAIKLNPHNATLFHNYADLLYAEGLYAESLQLVEAALQRNPDLLSAWVLKGRIVAQEGDRRRADACFNRALAIPPQSPEDRNNTAFLSLRRGDYARGWADHEARTVSAGYIAGYGRPDLAALAPTWRGEPLAGKSILLYGEQGNGDHIQFARYAAVLQAMGARVSVETLSGLVRLIAASVEAPVCARGEPVLRPDFVVSMMSCPAVLGTTIDTIPAPLAVPDFDVPASDPIAPFLRQMAAAQSAGQRLVGLGWTGAETNQINRIRSIPDTALATLRGTPGVTFVNLQPGRSDTFAREVGGIDPTAALVDFASTAAVMQRCDAVIGIDSAVSHLAGSVGVPLHVALSFHPDWRWMDDRSDSPWYPSATLYRQTAPNAWEGVLAAIRAVLETPERPAEVRVA